MLKTLHLPAFLLGLLITFGGVGSLSVTRLLARLRRRFAMTRLIVGGCLAYAMLNFSGPWAHGPDWIAFCFSWIAQFGGDLFATVFRVTSTVAEQQVTPDHWLGRVNGTFSTPAGGLEGWELLSRAPSLCSGPYVPRFRSPTPYYYWPPPRYIPYAKRPGKSEPRADLIAKPEPRDC